jgi:alditol oxidase
MALLPQMEAKLDNLHPRPHWAKLFTIPHENLSNRYAKIEDFKGLLSKYDPEGKFRNEYLNKNIFGK